jgi:hypothetical protein
MHELISPAPAATGQPNARQRPVGSVAACFLLICLVRAALKALGFHRTRTLAERFAGAAARQRRITEATAAATAANVARAAAFFPGRALCLEQSLVLHFLLRRAGLDSTLRLGVQPFPFAAHAWVEHAGQPVNETSDGLRGFIPLPALPGGSS